MSAKERQKLFGQCEKTKALQDCVCNPKVKRGEQLEKYLNACHGIVSGL